MTVCQVPLVMSLFLSLFLSLILGTYHVSATNTPPSTDLNIPTVVDLRIEGQNRTIFSGPIRTRGHNVTSASGVTLHCDGTNNHTNPTPGPTCTSALDDASKQAGFSWDGELFTEFDDFLITRIASSEQTATEFWGILVDFQFIPVGGCQQQVKHGDKVLFAFNAFNKTHFLSLAGPKAAAVNSTTAFTVTDGASGEKIANATVVALRGGPVGITNADGEVSLEFGKTGVHVVKAFRQDSIRSNHVKLVVT